MLIVFLLLLRTTFSQPAIGFDAIKLNLPRGCGFSRAATPCYAAEIDATHLVMLAGENIATYIEFEGLVGGVELFGVSCGEKRGFGVRKQA